MKTKALLMIIISIFSSNLAAQTQQESNLSQSYFLKARNRTSADENTITMIYINADSAGDDCRNENDNDACERFDNAVSQLNEICHTYNYQSACNIAAHLVAHDLAMRAIKAS